MKLFNSFSIYIYSPSFRAMSPETPAWRYTISWFPHTGDPVKSVILLTSGTRDSSGMVTALSLHILTRHELGKRQ